MCKKISFEIHLCKEDEKTLACELAAMEDFEGIYPDINIARRQNLKTWETFYHIASRLIDECTTLVATEDGKVIGLVNYICASAYGTINYLYVLPAWRHQGVGKALLKSAENGIASASIRFARVTVNLNEDSVIMFCKEMGYSVRQVIVKKRITPPEDVSLDYSGCLSNECDEHT